MEKVSDNVEHEFPARMSDGRFITNYYPNCEMNAAIQKNMTSWQYRQLLTKDSNNVINFMNKINSESFGKGSTSGGLAEQLNPRYIQKCNIERCQIEEVNPDGFGIVQDHS
jgi:hypothetical protein|tara:strand:+ start:422 stop:754 length:333 start_codon:yes stop_codon:yes gene_type:complete